MKKNKLFDHKLQINIDLNNLKSLINYDRNLITLHLKKHNELDSDPAKVPKESFLMVKLLI